MTNLESGSSCDTWGIDVESLRDIDRTDVEVAADGQGMELDDAIDCDLSGAEFDCYLETENEVDGYDAVIDTCRINFRWNAELD